MTVSTSGIFPSQNISKDQKPHEALKPTLDTLVDPIFNLVAWSYPFPRQIYVCVHEGPTLMTSYETIIHLHRHIWLYCSLRLRDTRYTNPGRLVAREALGESHIFG